MSEISFNFEAKIIRTGFALAQRLISLATLSFSQHTESILQKIIRHTSFTFSWLSIVNAMVDFLITGDLGAFSSFSVKIEIFSTSQTLILIEIGLTGRIASIDRKGFLAIPFRIKDEVLSTSFALIFINLIILTIINQSSRDAEIFD